MSRKHMPPYLITVKGTKKCSLCDEPFSDDSKPSVSKAFASHVRTAHAKKTTEEKVPKD